MRSDMQDVVSRLAEDPGIGRALMQLVILQSAGSEAAATALALLTSKSSSMAAACTSIPQCQPALLCLLKHSTPATRLAACICLRNICSAVDADDSNHGSKSEVNCKAPAQQALPQLFKAPVALSSSISLWHAYALLMLATWWCCRVPTGLCCQCY